jgi:phosphomannomutase
MALIASVSGVRGTLGGNEGQNLTPIDLARFAAAFASWVQQQGQPQRIVLGRDARPSGDMLRNIVSGTLMGMGMEVVDVGMAPTPTVELAVPAQKAGGGIILTASHNPIEWNALKLLNNRGEFLSAQEGDEILRLYRRGGYAFAGVQALGRYRPVAGLQERHIQQILALEAVDGAAIRQAGLRVAVDGVNSIGGEAIPALLEALGVAQVHRLHCEPTGAFPHNPEPLPDHLNDLRTYVQDQDVDLGLAVDPDVDRLAFVCEDGAMFGEEYTLVAVADYVLQQSPGPCVSNLSSSRALRDVAEHYGQAYYASAVGEANVVAEMKRVGAVIGGEGNGGVIYPPLHYGRDAMVGTALFLSYLAQEQCSTSALRRRYKTYYMRKDKLQLPEQVPPDQLLEKLAADPPAEARLDRTDGLKLDFADRWVHLRKSNTEPILRIYTEAPTAEAAQALAAEYKQRLQQALPSL